MLNHQNKRLDYQHQYYQERNGDIRHVVPKQPRPKKWIESGLNEKDFILHYDIETISAERLFEDIKHMHLLKTAGGIISGNIARKAINAPRERCQRLA
jgi:hypothetical protein